MMYEIRELSPRHGLEWITQGWHIFRREPGMLILLFLAFLVITFVLDMLTFIGQLIALIITPALTGGLLLAIKITSEHQTPRFGHFFAAFKDPIIRNRMLTLGVWTLVANVVIMLVGGSFLMGLMNLNGTHNAHLTDMMTAGIHNGLGVFALLIALAVALLYAAALFFATPLVMLGEMKPWPALKLSLSANLHNLGAWLVFGLIYLVLSTLAIIPFGLGLLIVGPMGLASAYCAYLDTFSPVFVESF